MDNKMDMKMNKLTIKTQEDPFFDASEESCKVLFNQLLVVKPELILKKPSAKFHAYDIYAHSATTFNNQNYLVPVLIELKERCFEPGGINYTKDYLVNK